MDLLTQLVDISARSTTPFHYPRGSLFFAPMEGITDEAYRLAVMELFPEWDAFATDFLRVPTIGAYSDQKILEHFGHHAYNNDQLKSKTVYQILTSERSQTEHTVSQIKNLGFKHLDLNLGCPSKTVNSHGGGAYLLSDLPSLRRIISSIRKTFPHLFTVKMRVGYRDDQNFVTCLKLLEDEGVQAITVHARTRDQMYKGVADWNYIRLAAQTVQIPIIGNGDIWTVDDIKRAFDYCGCHALMLARSAMKTPWIAGLYKHGQSDSLEIRKQLLIRYFGKLETCYRPEMPEEAGVLKRFKALSRNLFDDFAEPETLKSSFLRAKSLEEFKSRLENLT